MNKELVKNDEIQTNERLNVLANTIVDEVNLTKSCLALNISAVMVKTYWSVGHHIVEFEQDGGKKAKYGTSMLTNLAKILTMRLGRGYSRPNLNNMRKFYLLYPLCQTSDKLTWSHICELITIDDDLERSFYEKECVKENWDVRSLRRQMDSGLFLRLAASKDKEGILELAKTGIEIQKPMDVVKDTYTLEFLGLPEMERYSESDLEQRIIDNLQTFLLELGKGFAFIGRQYPITINNVHYHVDLVFYHRILKCFVLIDLNYGMDSNLFVSKYELYLPNREELRKLVSGILEEKI